MKAVSLFIFLFSSMLLADSAPFYLEKDGVRFYCAPTAGADPTAIANCISKAYSGPFSKDESEDLCQGASSNAPADCALEAYRGPFSKSDSINLCRGATSLGPKECATAAYRGPFSSSESIELCKNNGTLENFNCADKLYKGPYSKADSIRLCKVSTSPNDFVGVIKSESVLAGMSELSFELLHSNKLKEQYLLKQIKHYEQLHLKQMKRLD